MAVKIVQIFCFLVTLSGALALTCYSCDSSQSKACDFGLISFTFPTTECSEEGALGSLTNWLPKQCVKLVARDDQDRQYVARGCMPAIGGSACNAIAKSLGFFSSLDGQNINVNCYVCDGDKCNSGKRYTAYSLFGVVLAALLFLF